MTRPAAALFHVVGLGISGIGEKLINTSSDLLRFFPTGLKKCSGQLPFYVIVISLVIQLFGLIVYSNPNASIKLRCVVPLSLVDNNNLITYFVLDN